MPESAAMRKLLSLTRAACDRYQMIAQGDHVVVGLSGGKDSIALLCVLQELRRFYPARFTLSALTLDPQFFGEPADYSALSALCKRLEIPYTVRRTNLYEVVFTAREEKNPCSLCARMRRGLLHDTVKELGGTKLALGHHMDDAAETFYMNLLLGGQISCFAPVTHMTRKELFVIRPLVFAHEREVARTVAALDLPVVKSRCPVDKTTERQRTKALLATLERDYPGLTDKTLGALQRAGINGW